MTASVCLASGSSEVVGLRVKWGKMAAHLSYGRVNLNVLREAVRRELREFLDKCAGSKVRDGVGDTALEPLASSGL